MNWHRWSALRAPEGEGGGGGAAAGAGANNGGGDGGKSAGDAGAAKGADGGAAKAADGGGAAAAKAGDAGGAAAAGAVAGYRPDGLADHLYGGSDKETIDKLAKAYDGARKSIAAKGEMPADAKGYDYQPSDVVKPYATALANDPFFAKVQEAAFAHGLPKGQFNGFVNAILGEMIAGQMVEPPFSADKEREALVPGVQDPRERAIAADKLCNEAIARVKTWQAQGMPEAIAKDLLSRMDRASSVQLVNWIAAGRREQAPALGGLPAGGLTQADLSKRQADPKNQVGNSQYDKAFAAETDRLYKVVYPDTGER